MVDGLRRSSTSLMRRPLSYPKLELQLIQNAKSGFKFVVQSLLLYPQLELQLIQNAKSSVSSKLDLQIGKTLVEGRVLCRESVWRCSEFINYFEKKLK